MINPLGSVSVNATPVSAAVFAGNGLVIVNVSVLSPSSGTWLGLNASAIDGGLMTRFADSFKSSVGSGVGNLKVGSVSPTLGSDCVHGTGSRWCPR